MSRLVTVCRLDEVAPRSSRRYDVDGHRLAVIRFDGEELYVIGDRCSHADYSLADGEIDTEAGTIECWKHGSTFSVTSGEPTCLPATRPVATYEVKVVDGEVRVVLGE